MIACTTIAELTAARATLANAIGIFPNTHHADGSFCCRTAQPNDDQTWSIAATWIAGGWTVAVSGLSRGDYANTLLELAQAQRAYDANPTPEGAEDEYYGFETFEHHQRMMADMRAREASYATRDAVEGDITYGTDYAEHMFGPIG